MDLKLPTPIPYDEIDKYLDWKFLFFQREWSEDLTAFSCRYANGDASCHMGQAFLLKDDTAYETEDRDGYCTWYGRGDMDPELMAKWAGAHVGDTGIPYEFTGVVA